jgi:hypothetical protein
MQAMEHMHYIWNSLWSEDNTYMQTIVGSSCIIGAIGFYSYVLLKKYTMLQQRIVKLENNGTIQNNIESNSLINIFNNDIKYLKKSHLEHLKCTTAMDTKFLLLNDIVNNIEQTQANITSQLHIVKQHLNLLIKKDELLRNFMRTTNNNFFVIEQSLDRYDHNIERINDAHSILIDHKVVLDKQDKDLAILYESIKEAPDVMDYIFNHTGKLQNEIKELNTFLLNTARTEAKLNTLIGQLKSLQVIPEHT